VFLVKRVMTKKTAAEMAFVRLSDILAEIEVVVFPKVFDECKKCLEKDSVIIVWGRIDKREDQLSLIADRISAFDPKTIELLGKAEGVVNESKAKDMEITVPKGSGVEILQKVNKALREHPGKIKVAILL